MTHVSRRAPASSVSVAALVALTFSLDALCLGGEGPRPPVRRPARPPLSSLRGELPPGPGIPPEKLPAHFYGALGQVYLQYQQWAKAEGCYQQAYAKEKDAAKRVQHAYRLAQLHLRKKAYEKALPLLEEAVKNSPASVPSYEARRYRMTLASLYEKTKDLEKARRVHENWLRAAAKGYERTMARREFLRFLHRTGGLAAAIDAYEAKLKRTPDHLEALGSLRLIYTSIRPDATKALAVTERLAAADPDNKDAAICLLDAYERAREYNKAIALLKNLAAKHPRERTHLTTRLVYLYVRSGQKDQALEHTREMLDKGPKTSDLHARVAGIYLQLKMTAEALEQYEAAAKLAKRPADRERYILSAAYAARHAKQYAKSEDLARRLMGSPSRATVAQAVRLLYELYEEQNKLDQLKIRPGEPR